MRTGTAALANLGSVSVAALAIALSSPAAAQSTGTPQEPVAGSGTNTSTDPTGTTPTPGEPASEPGNTTSSAGTVGTGGSNQATPGDAQTGQITEIVVTAQRREENLQRVPLSVTAVTGEALKAANITDITRLEQVVPGVRIGRSGSDARPTIRGIITEAIGANSDPRIGFYVDDIYQSRTAQALTGFVDLERVEVQKGPQGTLYGRNSFGGNIAIYSTVPKDRFAAGVDALYGRFNRARVEGFVNVPVATDLAVRVAGAIEEQDGYVKNTSTGSDLGDEDLAYIRGIVRWAPSGTGLDVQLRGSYFWQGGAGISAFGYKSVGTVVDPNLIRAAGGTLTLPNGRVLTFPNGFNGSVLESVFAPGATDVPFNSRFRDGIPDINGADIGVPIEEDPFRINFDARPERETNQHQFSGAINYDFGLARFRSISSYTDFYALRQSDNDFSPAPLAVDSNLTKARTITQELQLLSSDSTSPFQWIVGGYYLNDRVEEVFFSEQDRTYPVLGQPSLSLFSPTLLPGAAAPNNTRIANNRSDTFSPVLARTNSLAGFVQASYTLFDQLRLTGGYRYTRDLKRYAGGVQQGALGPASFFAFDLNQDVDYTCPPAGQTTVLLGNNPASPESNATNIQNGLGILCGRRAFKFSTWRGAVDYQFTRRNMVYGSISRGIRSGGFNNIINTVNGLAIEFLPEKVTAYEVGTKNRFFNDTVQFNLAGYYNDYSELQQQRSQPSPSGLTVLSFVTNTGKSRAYGVEADVIWKPVPPLTLQAAVNYLNTRERDQVVGTFANGLCGVVAGGCPAPTPLSANPTPAEIAAYNAALLNNAFGVGIQGAPFPNPITDPNRFIPLFLPNGALAQSGGVPVYNYVIAGLGADGTTRFSSQSPLSPKWTINLAAAYDFELAGGAKLTPSVNSYFSSSYLNTLFTDRIGKQDSFTRTDVRLSFLSSDERYSVQAYVENIENSAPLIRVAFGGNRSLNGVFGTPRTFGIKAGVRFR